ncbi:hypothetical protein XSR1_100009 [Xenorhabdus szentirmaii DSM 16338]|uniref:Uncharacterized protein n=1 Tax=Xenorhabdus szentirmaii DSM 16338 TaxID=1427518 RepID=W1ITN5_9GAMM|nr:hypothetical protein XSR1_100009 [Xenorhabdus szentirmaii DSM 16338]
MLLGDNKISQAVEWLSPVSDTINGQKISYSCLQLMIEVSEKFITNSIHPFL